MLKLGDGVRAFASCDPNGHQHRLD